MLHVFTVFAGFAVCFFCLNSSGWAQDRSYPFERLGIDDGLSSFRVYDILQDSEGFLWMATFNGLNRYDGKEFVVYKHTDTSLFSLSDNIVTALCEDDRGNILVGTAEGVLNVFSKETERFTRYLGNRQDISEAEKVQIRAMYHSRIGATWVATLGGGLFKVTLNDSGAMEIVNYKNDRPDPFSISSDKVYAVCEDNSGNIWAGTDKGIDRLGGSGRRFESINHLLVGGRDAAPFGVTSLACDGSVIWVGMRNGLGRYDCDSGTFTRYNSPDPENNDVVTTISCDDRHVWFGTTVGLNRLEKRTGKIIKFEHDPMDNRSLANDYIYRIRMDLSGNVWIGTDKGLSMYSVGADKFVWHRSRPGIQIMAVYEDRRGFLWLGTTRGLQLSQLSAVGKLPDFGLHQQYLEGAYVQSITGDMSGDVWVGTLGGGLSHFSTKTGSMESFRWNSSGTGNRVMSLCSDNYGRVWIGTFGEGLAMFDPAQKEFRRFVHDERDPESLSDNTVMALLADNEGFIWAGTEGGGLSRFVPPEDSELENEIRFVNFKNNPGDSRSLKNNRISALFLDGNHDLWIGNGAGLDKVDLNTGLFEHPLTDGISFEGLIMRIEADDRGKLWLSTAQDGIYSYDPVSKGLRSFTSRDGLYSGIFYLGSARASNGDIIFGGENGFTRFSPDSIDFSCQCLNLALTEFKVLDNPMKLSSMKAGVFSLDHTQNYFSFEFALLGSSSQHRTTYEYKLEGNDDRWVQAGENRVASYNGVSPGSYVFRVRAFHPNSGWCSKTLAVPVFITPPFWDTWWFRVGMFGAGVGMLIAIHRYRLSKALEIERMRLRIAGDLHDDIGSSLGSIALSSDLMQKGPDADEGMKGQLQIISRLARETAEHLRDIVWVINPANDRLEFFVLKLKDEASLLLQGIEWSFQFQNTRATTRLNMELKHNVFLIFKEVLHNIARHAEASEVTIEGRIDDEKLMFKISDNGKGFDPQCSYNGQGLRNLRRRAEVIGGELAIISRPKSGTATSLDVKIP